MGSQFLNGVLLMGWLRSEISSSSPRSLARATRGTCWIVRSSKCMKGYDENMKVLTVSYDLPFLGSAVVARGGRWPGSPASTQVAFNQSSSQRIYILGVLGRSHVHQSSF